VPSKGFPWFALRTRSNFEKTAFEVLRGKGYEVFLPLYQSRRQWSDRTKIIERPLFPGYLFCRFATEDRLPVLVTPGVVNVIGAGRTPLPVPEYEVAAVQRIISSGLPARPWPFVRVGQKVVIERGPLAGIEGILESVRNSYRFVVSVGLLQRAVAAEVDADWVRPVSAHSRARQDRLARPVSYCSNREIPL